MALGPIARALVQVVVLGVSVLSRALPAAYAQAVQNAKKGGGAAAQSVIRQKMSRDEALQILNLSDSEVNPEAIRKQYEKYFAANSVEKGGSFYLQSKIYRAKELLDEYIKEKADEEQEKLKQEGKQ